MSEPPSQTHPEGSSGPGADREARLAAGVGTVSSQAHQKLVRPMGASPVPDGDCVRDRRVMAAARGRGHRGEAVS